LAKEPTPAEILKEVEWSKWLEILIPTLSPLLIAIAWVMLSKFDKKVQTLNSLIAIAEVVPSVDIGLPKGVVLGALYDKGDEAIATMVAIMEGLEGIPSFVTEQLEQLKLLLMQQGTEGYDLDPEDYGWPPTTEPEPPIPGIKETKEFLKALEDCNENAKKNLGVLYYVPYFGPAWISSCMFRKGFTTITDKYIKDKLF